VVRNTAIGFATVVVLLNVMWAAVYFGYRKPQAERQAAWVSCVREPTEEASYYLRLGNLRMAEAAHAKAQTCGEAP
jgi:hypothetical protein